MRFFFLAGLLTLLSLSPLPSPKDSLSTFKHSCSRLLLVVVVVLLLAGSATCSGTMRVLARFAGGTATAAVPGSQGGSDDDDEVGGAATLDVVDVVSIGCAVIVVLSFLPAAVLLGLTTTASDCTGTAGGV